MRETMKPLANHARGRISRLHFSFALEIAVAAGRDRSRSDPTLGTVPAEVLPKIRLATMRPEST